MNSVSLSAFVGWWTDSDHESGSST